jgi:hypothetical protein
MSGFLDAFAHDLFPDERSFQAFSFVQRPILAKLEQKVHTSSGRTWSYPCLIQASIAQGTTRAAVQEQHAQANDVANFDGEEFTLGYFPPGYKGGFEISDFDMALTEAAGGVPDGAYLELFAVKMKEQPKEFGQRQERYFLGKSGKSLARTTANVSTAVGAGVLGTTNFGEGFIQLANTGGAKDDLKVGAFRHAMILNAAINDASTPSAASLLGSGDDQKIYVRGIDIDNGRLFVSATSGGALGHSAMATAAGTSQVYLFNYSDFQGTGGGHVPNVMPPGVQDWIPATAFSPTAAIYTNAFYGVVRSRDSRLAGWRLPVVPGEQLDQLIMRALERAFHLYGVSGSYQVVLSPQRWTQLTQIATARGYRMLNGATATIGYTYIEIVHGEMRAECISCPAMDSTDIFFLKMDDDGWCVRSLGGGWPKIINGDGLKILRATADDKFELRTGSYFHYGVRGINQNGRGDLSSIPL